MCRCCQAACYDQPDWQADRLARLCRRRANSLWSETAPVSITSKQPLVSTAEAHRDDGFMRHASAVFRITHLHSRNLHTHLCRLCQRRVGAVLLTGHAVASVHRRHTCTFHRALSTARAAQCVLLLVTLWWPPCGSPACAKSSTAGPDALRAWPSPSTPSVPAAGARRTICMYADASINDLSRLRRWRRHPAAACAQADMLTCILKRTKRAYRSLTPLQLHR